ncbi:MAG TPA: ABC transporter ATP-binding protein [Candidatus Sulfotelmatobacter sp.]|jgi:ATP-binding cassette subfamily B multidrug efflux pump|nr:ABC transporter ATP-binding protein [Candidatus Sulfotelmatobacter sp.]
MSDFREEEKLGKLYDSALTRRLMKYLRPYRWYVVAAVSITLGVTAMEIVAPYLFHIAVDNFIVPGFNNSITAGEALRGLLWVVAASAGALVGSFGLQYAQVRIMQWVGQETMYDLRKEIFEHLQRLPMSFFDRSPVGRLVTRATTDVDALNDLFASGVVAMLNDFVLLFAMVAILFKWHPFLAFATLSPLPFMILLTYFFRNKVRNANRRIRTAIARINAFLQEHISGMAIVQLFNREWKSRKQFEELNRVHMEAYKEAIDAFSFFYPAVEFLSMAGLALLYWVGGLRAIAGTIEVGVLLAFMLYAQRFFRPIQDLSEKFNILQTAMAASERIFRLLDEPFTITSPAQAHSLPSARGEIEFRNVWFSYTGGTTPKEAEWVLRDVSFRVEPGQTLAIVGHTGAGKTTIIQLLLRFYDIQRGEILLDGVDIRTMELQELRRLFGIVLQDPFLFTGTLESNVKLGTETISRAATESALREVGLGPFLESQPQGVETPVTERGSTLSVGQRQLVSFARALAHNPKFLILDEATSSVDTKTELLIREALDRLLQGRTAVVIAHRLSTIQHAHRILVFHKGRLREQGSHQELLALRGIYYRLYQLQYKEQELVAPVPGGESGFSHPLPADD